MKTRTLRRRPAAAAETAASKAAVTETTVTETTAAETTPTETTLTETTTEAGTTRAANSAARIVSTAARWIYEGRRVDMQGLADELGVSRVTLFRRVGSREELISQALWRLTERMLEIAVERWEAERPDGELHTPGTIRHINAMEIGRAHV